MVCEDFFIFCAVYRPASSCKSSVGHDRELFRQRETLGGVELAERAEWRAISRERCLSLPVVMGDAGLIVFALLVARRRSVTSDLEEGLQTWPEVENRLLLVRYALGVDRVGANWGRILCAPFEIK